jgi:hypothetical protein
MDISDCAGHRRQAVKDAQLARIGRVARICEEAGDFPTIMQLDAMLDELRYLPRTARCAALADMLLELRWTLQSGMN